MNAQLLRNLVAPRRAIVDVLLAAGRPLGTLELEEATGVERSLLLVALGWLYAAGVIRVLENPESGDALRYGWALVRSTEAAA